MKTLEDLYQEIQENEELKEAFVTALKKNRVEDFLITYTNKQSDDTTIRSL